MHPNIYSSATSILGQISKQYNSLSPPSCDLRSHESFTLFYLTFVYIKALSEKYFWILIVLNVPSIVFLKQKLHFYFPFLYCFLTHERLVSASYTSCSPVWPLFLGTTKRMCSREKLCSNFIVIVPNLRPTFPLEVGNLSPLHFKF